VRHPLHRPLLLAFSAAMFLVTVSFVGEAAYLLMGLESLATTGEPSVTSLSGLGPYYLGTLLAGLTAAGAAFCSAIAPSIRQRLKLGGALSIAVAVACTPVYFVVLYVITHVAEG